MKEYIQLKQLTENVTTLKYFKCYSNSRMSFRILHREGNKPALIYSDGTFFYYTNGNSFRHKKI
jgi:hypothetical protein